MKFLNDAQLQCQISEYLNNHVPTSSSFTCLQDYEIQRLSIPNILYRSVSGIVYFEITTEIFVNAKNQA